MVTMVDWTMIFNTTDVAGVAVQTALALVNNKLIDDIPPKPLKHFKTKCSDLESWNFDKLNPTP